MAYTTGTRTAIGGDIPNLYSHGYTPPESVLNPNTLNTKLLKLGITLDGAGPADPFAHQKEPTEAEVLKSHSTPGELQCLILNHGMYTQLSVVINFCVNLKVLDLGRNFIKDISALAECSKLIKLDLHNNHITTLPGAEFWAGFPRLRILYLHGNSIGGPETLQATVGPLGSCIRLQVLTLFDTPISLRQGYRHHVVNLIWSLRALDRHVLSDSEVIEGADFPGRFGPLSHELSMQLFRPCRPYVWEEVALTYFFLHEVMAKQVRHSPIRSIQSFLRSCVERLRHRGGRGVVPPVVASMLGGFRDHKKNSLVDFQGGGWDPATSPNKYHMRITTPAAAAAVQRKPPTANAAAAGPIGELPAAPLQTAEVLALDTAAPAPAPAEPGAGPAADTNAPDATTPQPSPTDATTPPADAAGATATPPPAPGPPVQQQQQQQQQQPPHNPTAPMFAVDRLKLLASLQHTLSKAGDHPEYDDIDWEHELPAQVLEREADREYAKVMHMDVTMRLPQFERVMPDDEPLTSDSLLRIADDLMANSFNETSTSASERTATDIVYRSGVSPDKAVRDNVPDNFDTLLAGSQLLDKTASELERLQRSIRSARSKKPDSPDRLQREVSATASRVPEEVVIPMRRRLFEPKRAGEELRRYHEVTKQVLSEQRELQDEKQATVTGAKRAQNQERHFILNTQRKEEKANVVSFLRPLKNVESTRRKKKLQQKRAADVERKVEKVQTINGLSQLKQMEAFENRQTQAREAQAAHEQLVQGARYADDVQHTAKTEQHASKFNSRRAQLSAMRTERSERQATFSRYNSISSRMRTEEVRSQRNKRAQEAYKDTYKKRVDAAESRAMFIGWLDTLRENKTLDRLSKRATVWERAANMQELRLEAHKLQVQKARAEKMLEGTNRNNRLIPAKERLGDKAPSVQSRHMPAEFNQRNRLSHRGLPGAPASKYAKPVHMKEQVYASPGANLTQTQNHLSARSYPKQFWPGLPRAMQHEALIEEFEERWQAIGSFCHDKMCRLKPRHACDACFAKFSSFAGDQLVAAQMEEAEA